MPPKHYKYRAFISYKHGSSTSFAESLELAVKSYAKPLWQLPMAVFRDEKYLKPGLDLPTMIYEALEQSEFLIFLASPEAARSAWVRDELDYWCADPRRHKRLIPILTSGTIEIDATTKKIVWSGTDALPPSLAPVLEYVPFYVDMSKAVSGERQTLLDPDYKKSINLIVAALRNIDPIEMSGAEIRQHRRNILIRNALFAGIGFSSLAFFSAAIFAWSENKRAQHNAATAYARALAAQSQFALRDFPQRSLLLANTK